MDTKPPIINCHTHIFKSHAIPPYLAKTFLPWPLYVFASTGIILPILSAWFKKSWSPYNWPYQRWYRWIQKILNEYRSFIKKYDVIRVGIQILNTLLILHAVLFLFEKQLIVIFSSANWIEQTARWVKHFLIRIWLLHPDAPVWVQRLVIVYVILFLREGRKVIIGLFKNFFKLTGLWPDKKTLDFLGRYLNIGRFTFYINSADILKRLRFQYPPGSRFIVLPMDLEFIKAGGFKKGKRYKDQMNELAGIKNVYKDIVYPFVFVDPRRIEKDPAFFTYSLDFTTGLVTLGKCFIKTYIEEHKFSGFKIYPALGYYPFDERLLILWKYAMDKGLPIMTHAIRGTIYYRGPKKREWRQHPVFIQGKSRQPNAGTEPLLLPEQRNINFINNFTHPLNYLCLVDEHMLRKVVAQCSVEIKSFFGYDTPQTPLKHNLNELKICMGHYGGEDEWKKYLELDRDQYTHELIKKPLTGIEFFKNNTGHYTERKIEPLWKGGDWYSIISSLMLQYPNIYADLSYIIHDPEIIPLLRSSLANPELRKRILFGTDFYVVRNHKSEKEMLGELQANLSEADFDQIARINPVSYLKSIHYPA